MLWNGRDTRDVRLAPFGPQTPSFGPTLRVALIRFRPPRVALTADLRWALSRAFAAPEKQTDPPANSSTALDLARRLDLAPRIASRIGRDVLSHELGAEGARGFIAVSGVAQMTAGRLTAVAREVAEVATVLGAPLVLLKGAALAATKRVPEGSRWSSDVDVLVSESALDALARALVDRGFRKADGVLDCDHQLPPFEREPGERIELHRFLPGVTRPGELRFASLEGLKAAGALEPVEGWPAGTLVPSIGVLAAHALVHGIAQHGLAPRTYPLMRMLSDLVDLGAAADAGDALMADAHAWTARHVDADEVVAVRATLSALAAGRVENSALLDHVLAGLLDDRYADSLKLRGLGSEPSHRSPLAARAHAAWHAVFPGRARLAGLSPGKSTALGAVLRPFVVAARAARALAAAVR